GDDDHAEVKVAADGTLAFVMASQKMRGERRKLVIDDLDPGAHLARGPRSRDEFLALSDDVLVPYASQWMLYREQTAGDKLTPTEKVITWVFLADDAAAHKQLASFRRAAAKDLGEIIDALRKVGLTAHADALVAGADWSRVSDRILPKLAGYMRAHDDD